MSEPYRPAIDFCERRLAEHGDSPLAVGWTAADAPVRYRVMLEVVRPSATPVTLLDFGCGASHLYEHMRREGVRGIRYHGLDVSAPFLALSRRKHPEVPYLELDVLAPGAPEWPSFDYVVMNGILTYRGATGEAEMLDYCRRLLRAVAPHARVGLAFNAMSRQVDWERDDLFHLPLDPLLDFLSREVSRHVVVRHDYGLYEYTVYVYREPAPGGLAGARRLVEPRR